MEAIHRAAKGEATLHPRVTARVIKQFSSGEPARNNLFTELTERELEVLTLIAKGYTNQKIALRSLIRYGEYKIRKMIRAMISALIKYHGQGPRKSSSVTLWGLCSV